MYVKPVITVEKWRDVTIGDYRIEMGKLYAQVDEFILLAKGKGWPWWILFLLLLLEEGHESERRYDREERRHAAG